MDDTRQLDYVFFTVREFAYKVFSTVVNDLTDMLMKSRPEDKRICVINFDHDGSEDTGSTIMREHVQLEYTTIKPDTNTASIQLCVGVALLESRDKDMWHLVVDIPSTRNHFEYDFYIEQELNDEFDKDTAYCFKGNSRSNGMPSDMTDYQGYKYYKQFLYDSIQRVVSHAHVAIKTDPDDPDAFVYR